MHRIEPSPAPLELRFPNRLKNIKRVGIEIAQSIGQFGDIVGRGRPVVATFADFRIFYFTPFNQPTRWNFIDWQDKDIRLYLHGLVISKNASTCLQLYWNRNKQHVDEFSSFKGSWDLELREKWASFKTKQSKLERMFGVSNQRERSERE